MPDDNPYQAMIEQAIQTVPPDKQIYFNGFACAIRAGEFILILQQENRPLAVLRTSHSVGKSLAEILTEFVQRVEQQTGQRILNLGEFQNAMAPPSEESNEA